MYCLPILAGKNFHVRMHRRGFKGRISSHDEERFLDTILLEELGKIGNPNLGGADLLPGVLSAGEREILRLVISKLPILICCKGLFSNSTPF